MQTFRIGNQAGFTLIEMLAVITLIGLITALVWPVFILSSEKAQIQYLERLIKVDLAQVQNEAIVACTALTVNFRPDGYCFILGSKVLERHFTANQFLFDLPEQTEIPKTKLEATSEATASPEATNSPQTDEAEMVKPKEVSSNLFFNKEGNLFEEYQLNWQTTHFQGVLKVQSDGKVKWEYARRNSKSEPKEF